MSNSQKSNKRKHLQVIQQTAANPTILSRMTPAKEIKISKSQVDQGISTKRKGDNLNDSVKKKIQSAATTVSEMQLRQNELNEIKTASVVGPSNSNYINTDWCKAEQKGNDGPNFPKANQVTYIHNDCIPEEDEVIKITSKEPVLAYWKELAEERRLALEEALKENEDLRDQIEVLEKDNEELQVIANEAKNLAEILQSINSDNTS